jgi:hypothetical protein
MILELCILFTIIFLIAALFYKQRRDEISILQIEQGQLATSSELFAEKQPLILRGASAPQGLTAEGLKQIPRLANFPVGPFHLSDCIANPAILQGTGTPLQTYEQREQLAEELSIPIWANITWRDIFAETSWIGWAAGTLKSQFLLGGQGLSKTEAIYTLILPTSGTYLVSLLSKASEIYLPTPAEKWLYRYPTTLSVNDTPLVAELRYIDIVVRPGTGLCLPPHMVYSIQPKEAVWSSAAIVEYHEPITLLTRALSKN